MKTAKDVLKSIKDNDVKYVDLRFTDPRGKWQHVTFDAGMIVPRSRAGRRSTNPTCA
jgi:glutamine synthetase